MPQSGNVPPAESSRPAHPVSVKLMSMRRNETLSRICLRINKKMVNRSGEIVRAILCKAPYSAPRTVAGMNDHRHEGADCWPG